MAVSPFFSDDELESSLRSHFDYDEMWNIDFKAFFNQIEDCGDYLYLELKGKKFKIDKVTCSIEEVS